MINSAARGCCQLQKSKSPRGNTPALRRSERIKALRECLKSLEQDLIIGHGYSLVLVDGSRFRKKRKDGKLKDLTSNPSSASNSSKTPRRLETVRRKYKYGGPIRGSIKITLPIWGRKKRRKRLTEKCKYGIKLLSCFYKFGLLIPTKPRTKLRRNRKKVDNGRIWYGGTGCQKKMLARRNCMVQEKPQTKLQMIVYEPKDQFNSIFTGMTGMVNWNERVQWNMPYQALLEFVEQQANITGMQQGALPNISGISTLTFSSIHDGESSHMHIVEPASLHSPFPDNCQNVTSSTGIHFSLNRIYDSSHTRVAEPESLDSSFPADNSQAVTLSTDLERRQDKTDGAMPATCHAGVHESSGTTFQNGKSLRALLSQIRSAEVKHDTEPPQKVKRKKHRPKVKREIRSGQKQKGPSINRQKDTHSANGLQDAQMQLAHDDTITEECQDGYWPVETASTCDTHVHPLQSEGPQQIIQEKNNHFLNAWTNAPVFQDNRIDLNNDYRTASTQYFTNREDNRVATEIVDFCQGHQSAQQYQGNIDGILIHYPMYSKTYLSDADYGNQLRGDGNPVLHDFFGMSQVVERPLCVQCSDQPQPPQSCVIDLHQYRVQPDMSSTPSTHLALMHGNSTQLTLASRKVLPNEELQMVPYNQKRDIVLSKPKRPKKQRAKVQLDPETYRVWLQLENGATLPEEEDEQRAMEWEKERASLKKHVDSFITTMHTVQGNRRFSHWKGSVVDSVVGAFLTQNVSDHLSSSAFMSIASRYPRNNKGKACSSETCKDTSELQNNVQGQSLVLERVPTISREEQSLDKKGNINANTSVPDEESTNAEAVYCDFHKPPEHLCDNKQHSSQCCIEDELSTAIEVCNDVCISTSDPHNYKNVELRSLACDDERHSSTAAQGDLDNDSTSIRQSWATFGQRTSVYKKQNVCRKLNFGSEALGRKGGLQRIPPLESVEQVNSAQNCNIEVHLTIQSGQYIESGGSQNGQDPTVQLKMVQDSSQGSNCQIEPLQDTMLPLLASKTNKKRALSISSMSGIGRAQLEVSHRGRKKNHHQDWESVRKQIIGDSSQAQCGVHKEQDSVDWDAVRRADLQELADTIKERGMHHILSGRIKAFLETIYEENGSIDLEWIRNLSVERAREYLMSIHGLGVKSVECIRLLTLHHLAFPVDTNVGRICVRLGWVPIEPLPEELQLHLLELYPIQESIQKYLWPRLCKLDQRTLYELHYQLITFGKVFCTKTKPNCNSCPMRTECKHFASAYASAKPLLTGTSEGKTGRIATTAVETLSLTSIGSVETALLGYSEQSSKELTFLEGAPLIAEVEFNRAYPFNGCEDTLQTLCGTGRSCEFIVEEPTTPEQAEIEDIVDVEDMGKMVQYIYSKVSDYADQFLADSLPSVQSLVEESCVHHGSQNDDQLRLPVSPFLDISISTTGTSGCQCQSSNVGDKTTAESQIVATLPVVSCGYQATVSEISSGMHLYPSDVITGVNSNAIVPLPPEAAQIPVPKLKYIDRLRTVHFVYELPDNHPLLFEMDPREKDDPCFYLFAIWGPGETPESQKEIDELCGENNCEFPASNSSSQNETVSGTLLIPCRTAMHGSFPLNGTYFQVNEVFADYQSSLHPIEVPRSILWRLRRRFVYFGTSVPSIFKGLSQSEITDCFWRGYVCVRGFDGKTRAPKPLACRLHFPISKQQNGKKKARDKG